MITNERFMGRLAQAGALSLLLGLFCVPFTGAVAQDRAGEGGKVRKEGEKRVELGEREKPKGDVEALELHLKELKHKIQALAAEGKGAAAEEVEREARGVAEKLERIRAERGERDVARKGGNEVELKRNLAGQELERLERRLQELREKEGPEAEAERRKIENAMREIRARVDKGGGDRREGPPEGDRAELERRLRHLRAAAENLAAAGMEDAARRVLQDAEQLERRLAGGEGARDERRREAVPAEALQRHVEELTGGVRELRMEVQNLKRQVQELKERDR